MTLPAPAWLFCPADRSDRYAKAAAVADLVILDLEDAVAPANKPGAREAVRRAELDPARVIVRVNPVGTPFHDPDLAMVRSSPYRAIMLAKAEAADQLDALGDFAVIALIETAIGVLRVEQIAAHPATAGLMWGAEDLIASIGGQSSRNNDGAYREVCRHARSSVLLAAGAHGKAAVDSVYLNIPDLAGLSVESADATASGFTHKACIHPSHVEPIRAAFRPKAEQLDWARRVLAAVREGGVATVDGRMVDAPVLRQAERIVQLGGD
ncbi:MAG: CoA ester lyase [Actinobacteria bacterium]|nr:CoA ester lyase [Actinomycetota bacterium]